MTKVELNRLVVELLGSEEAMCRWWHTPNHHWNGESPYQVWIRVPEVVEDYVTIFDELRNETKNL